MRDEATTVDTRPANLHGPVDARPQSRHGSGEARRSRITRPVGVEAVHAPARAPSRPHMRLVHGMRRPANWLQLVRFGIVGGVGFAVNLAVYTFCVHGIGIDYRIAAVIAWVVAVLNNFVLNRHWTFDAGAGRASFQAARFIVVSLVAFGCSLLLLTALVEAAGLAKVAAQALAVLACTPLNFLGNKLWSFRSEAGSRGAEQS